MGGFRAPAWPVLSRGMRTYRRRRWLREEYRFGHQLVRLAMASPLQPAGSTADRVRIVVATSVMLTFISYWRAAAIVLNDLGSSAFYAAGIAEQAIGKSAPWFILAVMLFSFAVRAVYVESCSMFVRGGVYRVVKEALGGTLAKVSVSALMFDYILTGPISGVSAGQYIAGLINDTFVTAEAHGWIPRAMHNLFHGTPHLDVNWTSVSLCPDRDHLFLVAEHQGYSGIQRKGPAGHADHHRHGGDPAGLVGHHPAEAGLSSRCRCPLPDNLKFSEEAWVSEAHRPGARPGQEIRPLSAS